MLHGYVQAAVTSFLHGQKYGGIVDILADSSRQKRPLDDRLQKTVVEEAARGGRDQGPIASIRDLPGSRFIGGGLQAQADVERYEWHADEVETCRQHSSKAITRQRS